MALAGYSLSKRRYEHVDLIFLCSGVRFSVTYIYLLFFCFCSYELILLSPDCLDLDMAHARLILSSRPVTLDSGGGGGVDCGGSVLMCTLITGTVVVLELLMGRSRIYFSLLNIAETKNYACLFSIF